jgi:ribosomal protein L11 methyltransferase
MKLHQPLTVTTVVIIISVLQQTPVTVLAGFAGTRVNPTSFLGSSSRNIKINQLDDEVRQRTNPLLSQRRLSLSLNSQRRSIDDTNDVVATDENSSSSAAAAATLHSVTFCNVDKEAELLCDFLMEVGACAAYIVDADRGTPNEKPLFGEPGSDGRVVSTSASNNTTTTRDAWHDSLNWAAAIWDRCNVTAHFPSSINVADVAHLVADVFPDQYPIDKLTVKQVPNKDWVVHVQRGWSPIVIGNYILRFPWHAQQDIEKAERQFSEDNNGQQDSTGRSTGDRLEIKLQGGIAFGTGEHPTTQLCLEWLHDKVQALVSSNDEQQKEFTIMDYGSGSGILGLAGCAVAPDKIRSVGVDIDLDAIQIANANAASNGMNMHSYLPPLVETDDDESKSLLLKSHAHAKNQLQEREDLPDPEDLFLDNEEDSSQQPLILPDRLAQPNYDIAVANILAGPLVTLSSTIAALVRPGGQLAMSGILAPQADMFIEAYSKHFDNVMVEKQMGDWILVTGTRRVD